VQGLRPLPASQGVRTALIAAAGDRQPLAAFQPPSHRLGRPTASVFYRPHSPPYCGRPLYPLGGGYPPEVDHRRQLRSSLSRWLGLSFWRSSADHIGQGHSVYFFGLVVPPRPPRYQEQADHALPPTGQRRGRAFPSPFEGRPPSSSGGFRLAFPPALGSVGPKFRTTGGLWCLRRRAGLRLPIIFAWPVSHRLRATAGLFHLPPQLFSSLRGGQLAQPLAAVWLASTTGSGFRVHQGPPSVASVGSGLQRPLPSPGARREVLRSRSRRPAPPFLRHQPEASPRQASTLSGFLATEGSPQEVVSSSQPRPQVKAGGG
jgi:hypothetical protein